MKYTVNVTQEDIDKGVQNDCFSCPIGLALHKLFPKNIYRIYNHYINFFFPGQYNNPKFLSTSKSFDLPLEAKIFITNFDSNTNDVKPFSFEIEIEL